VTKTSGKRRTDSASRAIMASPRTIYRAFMDPKALASWLPPEGMKGHIYEFDAREDGSYRMVLTYDRSDHSTPGKTSEHSDVVRGRFLQLAPDEQIVQLVEFESEDPAFAGANDDDMDLDRCPGRHRSYDTLRERARRNTAGRSRCRVEVDTRESRGVHRTISH
jgi:uncharacterized protein YndB with AHSA1/START domain